MPSTFIDGNNWGKKKKKKLFFKNDFLLNAIINFSY